MPRYIDLTIPYDEKIPGFSRKVARTLERDGWYAHDLQIYSHSGTHMDAPVHFGVNPSSIDEWAPERLITECHVVRIEDCPPQKRITIDDLGHVRDQFKPGQSLLLVTGWHQFIGQEKYRNELPGISAELADWMAERQVNMVLVEPPSVADVNNREEVTDIHQRLLGGDIIIVEGVTNTFDIRTKRVRIVAFPLKIRKGDGAPARVIAIEDQ